MPIWLRKFIFNKLKEYYDKINNDDKTLTNNTPISDKKLIHPPNFSGYSYSSKSSKSPKK